MELAYFSFYARARQRQTGGAGMVLRFERVRPRQSRRFQPRRSSEITPQFLDRAIHALKRWKLDIVSMDEVCKFCDLDPIRLKRDASPGFAGLSVFAGLNKTVGK